MDTAIARRTDFEAIEAMVQVVQDALNSRHSKTAYGAALRDFLSWYTEQGRPGLTRAVIQRYKAVLENSGLAPSSCNLRLAAIKKLVREAAENGLQVDAESIRSIEGFPQGGERLGTWLTKEQAQALLNAPDTSTLKGKRDRAILAVMLGAGLRRSEVVNLEFRHIQQLEGRWVIRDIVGKRKRVRTVPISGMVKVAIDEWAAAAGISEGRVFRAVHRYGKTLDESSEGITTQIVWLTVKEYLARLGVKVAPHDLRRTFAKLAHKGGAPLDQIMQTLGHSSIETTQRYLGLSLDLDKAACDYVGLTLEKED